MKLLEQGRGHQLVRGLALTSALLPQTLSCSVCMEVLWFNICILYMYICILYIVYVYIVYVYMYIKS